MMAPVLDLSAVIAVNENIYDIIGPNAYCQELVSIAPYTLADKLVIRH